MKCGVSFPQCSSRGLEGGTVLTVFSVVPLVQAVTINYHHTTGSRAPSLDDDEEEEDRLHAMISMICSRNLTDPNVMKGFYHLNTPTQPYCPPPTRETSPGFRRPSPLPTPPPPSFICLCVCFLRLSPTGWSRLGLAVFTRTWGSPGLSTLNGNAKLLFNYF